MTDTTNPSGENDAPSQKTELDLLKERATTMGITFRDNIGVDKLKEKINAKLTGGSPSNDDDEKIDDAAPVKETEAQRRTRIRAEMRKEKMKLVRCRVANLDPSKNDLRGEIFTVQNRILGRVSRFIPYGEQTDGGYHIEQVLFDELKRRRFQQVKTKKVKGQLKVETRMVPEFSLEVLTPLTEEELKTLGDRQAAAARLEGSDAA